MLSTNFPNKLYYTRVTNSSPRRSILAHRNRPYWNGNVGLKTGIKICSGLCRNEFVVFMFNQRLYGRDSENSLYLSGYVIRRDIDTSETRFSFFDDCIQSVIKYVNRWTKTIYRYNSEESYCTGRLMRSGYQQRGLWYLRTCYRKGNVGFYYSLLPFRSIRPHIIDNYLKH